MNRISKKRSVDKRTELSLKQVTLVLRESTYTMKITKNKNVTKN